MLTTNVGTVTNAGHTVSVPLAAFPTGRVQVNTLSGTDTVTLDCTNGLAKSLGTGGVLIDLGAGTDRLKIIETTKEALRGIPGLVGDPAGSSSTLIAGGGVTTVALAEAVEVTRLASLAVLARNQTPSSVWASSRRRRGKSPASRRAKGSSLSHGR